MSRTAVADATAVPGFVRRNRVAIALGVLVLVVLVAISWLGRGNAGRGGALDPQNPRPGGARAAAQVLGDQGVPVRIVRGRERLDEAAIDAGTTVVVSNPQSLGASTWQDVDERVRDAGGVLVVFGIGYAVADALGLGETRVGPGPEEQTVPAECSPAQSLMDGLTLTSDYASAGVIGDGCFGDARHRQLLIDRQRHRWVLINPHPLSNEEIDRGDNAAVVLRLLGQRDRVVWYVASSADTTADDAVGISRLLPRWLMPSLWLLAISAVALLLWRGRRLGPLVTEPVPVTIKALESTTALGRLYERARDRGHAAGLLVDGSTERLRGHLGLSPTATLAEVIRAVGASTGRTVESVAAVLLEPGRIPASVRSDADLLALAQNLHQLEEEVRTR